MDVHVRKLRAGEAEAFVHSVFTPFLDAITGDAEQAADVQREIAQIEVDRAWVAAAGGRFVGNACIMSLNLTLAAAPGRTCLVLPMAGVSAVGVHPTHRRRGLLRQLMTEMLDDARRRGEPFAGLNASESVIYGRFGFGLATDMVTYSIDTRHTDFVAPAPDLDLRLIDRDEALKVLPELYDRQRLTRAGEPSRSLEVWEAFLADPANRRDGGSGLFHAVCDEGYVAYRRGNDPRIMQAEKALVVVEELRGLTPDVEAGLWRFVFDLDLVGRVQARRRPVDEPLRWRLSDPRQLQADSLMDRLYIRILDVPKSMEGRGYRTPGRLVLDVQPAPVDTGHDPAVGRWVVEADTEGCSCRSARPGEDADLRLDVTALGSIYLGGFPASLLAAAGRITELTTGSLDVADALFATRPAPLSATGF